MSDEILAQIQADIAYQIDLNEWCLFRWGVASRDCTAEMVCEAMRLRDTPIGAGFTPAAGVGAGNPNG